MDVASGGSGINGGADFRGVFRCSACEIVTQKGGDWQGQPCGRCRVLDQVTLAIVRPSSHWAARVSRALLPAGSGMLSCTALMGAPSITVKELREIVTATPSGTDHFGLG